MDDEYNEIAGFALQKIEASKHLGSSHQFAMFKCEVCEKSTPQVIAVRYVFGSDYKKPPENFLGHIQGECIECGKTSVLFSNADEDDKIERTEHPECTCGNKTLRAGMAERIEGEDGIPGYFDEGIIVARCEDCDQMMVIARFE